MTAMKTKQGIKIKSDIRRIENGYLLTYSVAPYEWRARVDDAAIGTECYKTHTEATARLLELLLKSLENEHRELQC